MSLRLRQNIIMIIITDRSWNLYPWWKKNNSDETLLLLAKLILHLNQFYCNITFIRCIFRKMTYLSVLKRFSLRESFIWFSAILSAQLNILAGNIYFHKQVMNQKKLL